MKIGIIGLGYVGLSTGLGLAKLGHTVFGYEKIAEKRKKIQNGLMPIFEEGMQEILDETLNKTFLAIENLSEL